MYKKDKKYWKWVELNYLTSIADDNLKSAEFLNEKHKIFSSLQLYRDSLEKFLKILWASDKNFEDEKNLDEELKKFNHDLTALMDNLVFDIIKTYKEKNSIKKLSGINYNGIKYGVKLRFLENTNYFSKDVKKFIENIKSIIEKQKKIDIKKRDQPSLP